MHASPSREFVLKSRQRLSALQRFLLHCDSRLIPHQAVICIFKKASLFPQERRIHLYKHCVPPTVTAIAHVSLTQALKMTQKKKKIQTRQMKIWIFTVIH